MQAQLPLPQILSQSLSTLHCVEQQPGRFLGARPSLAEAALSLQATASGASAGAGRTTLSVGAGAEGPTAMTAAPLAAMRIAAARSMRKPWFLSIGPSYPWIFGVS